MNSFRRYRKQIYQQAAWVVALAIALGPSAPLALAEQTVQIPPDAAYMDWAHGFYDNFQVYQSTRYNSLTTTNGTVASTTVSPGGVILTTTAASNNALVLTTTVGTFKFENDKPLHFKARISVTELNTNQNNLFIGMASGPTTTLMQSAGAGPRASGVALAFYKADGATLWNAHTSISATQQQTTLLSSTASFDRTAHTCGSNSDQVLEIMFKPKTSSAADVVFLIDGSVVYKYSDWAYGSSTVYPVFGIMCGTAGNAMSATLRNWAVYQRY